MTRVPFACAAVLLAVAMTAARAALPAALTSGRVPSLAPLVQRVSPAVVEIRSHRRTAEAEHDAFAHRFLGGASRPDAGTPGSIGSGVIVDARQGYLLTNAHVVRGATAITVTLANGHSVPARVIGSDASTDIAVLKIHAHPLTALPLGHSGRLRVGDFVLALGTPFGLPRSVSAGIVSGLDRSRLKPDGYEDYIQTDAAINPGNSGGALVDLRGHLVGINTAILTGGGESVGIGFAIPIDEAARVMRELIAHGVMRRGILGVTLYPLTPPVARILGGGHSTGGLVVGVVPGSAAARAGIRAGDVLIRVAGRRVCTNSDLRRAIALDTVGQRIKVSLLRDGRPRRLTARLEDDAAPTG